MEQEAIEIAAEVVQETFTKVPPETVEAESLSQRMHMPVVKAVTKEPSQEVPASGRLFIIPLGGVLGFACGLAIDIPLRIFIPDADRVFISVGIGGGLLVGTLAAIKPYLKRR